MSPGYETGEASRDALFRQFLTPVITKIANPPNPVNPYWGEFGAHFAWSLACVPVAGDDVEVLGANDDGDYAVLAGAAALDAPDATDETLIVELARRDFAAAVDLLFTAAAPIEGVDAAQYGEVAGTAVRYAAANKSPAWTNEVQDDQEFVDLLQTKLEEFEATHSGTETLGFPNVWNAIKEGVDHVQAAAANTIGGSVWSKVRTSVLPAVVTFSGDVFAYQTHRGTPAAPGQISTEVVGAFEQANALRTADDPYLIVVAHSMGGVICYDLLSSFVPDFKVDVLVTVGSQVGLFEEMKLFLSSDPAIGSQGNPKKVPARPNVGHWVNVFDYNDVLSYRAEPIFDGVEDHSYATGHLVTAHTAYFSQPVLHDRIARRVATALETLAKSQWKNPLPGQQ
jgi:hypothetical protein